MATRDDSAIRPVPCRERLKEVGDLGKADAAPRSETGERLPKSRSSTRCWGWLERAGISAEELTLDAQVRLRTEAERLKIALSQEEESAFRVPFFDGVRSIEVPVSRGDLDKLAAPWIARTLRLSKQALADAFRRAGLSGAKGTESGKDRRR